jgi:hypothetical protein
MSLSCISCNLQEDGTKAYLAFPKDCLRRNIIETLIVLELNSVAVTFSCVVVYSRQDYGKVTWPQRSHTNWILLTHCSCSVTNLNVQYGFRLYWYTVFSLSTPCAHTVSQSCELPLLRESSVKCLNSLRREASEDFPATLCIMTRMGKITLLRTVSSRDSTGSLESHCALTKSAGSGVHERLFRPEPV